MIIHFTLVTGAETVGCRFQLSFNISNWFFQNFAPVIVCWKKKRDCWASLEFFFFLVHQETQSLWTLIFLLSVWPWSSPLSCSRLQGSSVLKPPELSLDEAGLRTCREHEFFPHLGACSENGILKRVQFRLYCFQLIISLHLSPSSAY